MLLYCGAHGISHALGRLLEVAERLRADDPRFHLLLVGEGAEKDALVERASERGLTNVTFLPAVPREQVATLYRSADLCLVPLRAVPLFRGFIPSKMFEILACGRPILASARGRGGLDPARVGRGRRRATGGRRRARRRGATARGRSPTSAPGCAASGRPYVAAHFDRDALGERYLGVLAGVPARPPATAIWRPRASSAFQVPCPSTGLRSFDRSMPDKVNLLVTDAIADLLLTPSPTPTRNCAARASRRRASARSAM